MVNEIGKWSFIIGAILAIVLGVLEGAGIGLGVTGPWLILLLLIIGLVIGIVNITAKEVHNFLVAAIAVLVSAGVANLTVANTLFSPLGTIIAAVANNLILVIAPAALIVALRTVYGFAAE